MSSPGFRYEDIPASYYDEHTDPAKYGRFAAWYHSSRYARLAATVAEYSRPGDIVVDLACGSAVWNTSKQSILGVDINPNMLAHGIGAGRLRAAAVSDLTQLGLAGASVDLIVSSEVLEHMRDKESVVAEYFRVLKPGGKIILTVPFDRPGTPFFLLFNVQCFYQGWIKDSAYYRAFCGHVNHFGRGDIRRLLTSAGFQIERQFLHNYFLVYTVASRPV